MLSCMSMPVMTFLMDNHVVVTVSGDIEAHELERAMRHVTGETYDWWYGEIAPGVDAYSITTEDEHGNVGNPDWHALPPEFRDGINTTLGKMNDDPARLRAAADYLEAHRGDSA